MNKNLFTIEVKGECEKHEADHKHLGEFSTTIRGLVVAGEDEGQYLHREDLLRVLKNVVDGYRQMFDLSKDPMFYMGGNMVGAVGALIDFGTVPEKASILVDTLPDNVGIPAEWLEG